MPLAISLGVLLNAAATLYARATRPGTPPAIAVAPPAERSGETVARELDRLVSAYPDHLRGHDGTSLLWRAGPPTPIGRADPARAAQRIVDAPTVRDIFAWPYPLGPATAPAGDPGRARPAALFTRMYGDCAKGEVEPHLVPVRWVGGRSLRFTRINGAAAALEAAARDLEALGPAYARYLWPTSGSYACRAIAGTEARSMHGYGAAIDLASRYGDYWRWSRSGVPGRTIPPAIVAVFERHGFIWGGKWAHFDSFHFEYRPEIIAVARDRAAASS
ncbi:M15 family metallopeptidase [Sphingomonas profundi]|uniref:M15 family metallopeptidase n=1 Tax=Alterirhizorhabdus profundi TaxID=2681549 RepID=UPI0012E7604B|nr:M15 family metallopeptidase [Sphingomonas profundi]